MEVLAMLQIFQIYTKRKVQTKHYVAIHSSDENQCIFEEVANQWWHSGVKVFPPMQKPVYLRHAIPLPVRGGMAFVEMLTSRMR
jgi:hypothetical protein